MSIRVFTDSTSYIDDETRQELGITAFPLSVHFPDESFKETEVEYDYFYNKIDRTGIIPTSSQPAMAEIYSAFEETVSRGDQVIAIFISSDMSGTYESALVAKDMLLKKHPAARIEVLDSRTNCMAMGLSVIEAARAVKEGLSLDETLQRARSIINRVQFYFIPATLDYLKKGGRIGGAAALIGSMLSIRPILHVDKGKTALLEKVRGARTAFERLLTLLEKADQEYGITKLVVHHIHDLPRGQKVAQMIADRYGFKPPVLSIGPVIGTHVGPGAVGIVYVTQE
ncbi:MAG: DegV family protein [Syntrophomonadaceae bacterium]|jgi:DegV family protein with EDD domain|nr:DegV family protein [Syntrophomonadaceae bacterium]